MKPDQTPFPCRFHWGLTQMYETTPNTQQCIRMIVDASHEFFFVMTDSISDFHQYLYIHQTRNSLCLHRQGWKFLFANYETNEINQTPPHQAKLSLNTFCNFYQYSRKPENNIKVNFKVIIWLRKYHQNISRSRASFKS